MRILPELVLLVCGASCLTADTTTLDFEDLPDSTALTSQYAGLTFSNALILTSGIGLNEFEFPPHSGVNVASDNGGPMFVSFAVPITSFGGYFTYAEPITISAFGSGNDLVASKTSNYSDNEALSGDTGSSPNELLALTFAGGISKIEIVGDPSGGSFALDDVVYGRNVTTTPEPTAFPLAGLGLLIIASLGLRNSDHLNKKC